MEAVRVGMGKENSSTKAVGFLLLYDFYNNELRLLVTKKEGRGRIRMGERSKKGLMRVQTGDQERRRNL